MSRILLSETCYGFLYPLHLLLLLLLLLLLPLPLWTVNGIKSPAGRPVPYHIFNACICLLPSIHHLLPLGISATINAWGFLPGHTPHFILHRILLHTSRGAYACAMLHWRLCPSIATSLGVYAFATTWAFVLHDGSDSYICVQAGSHIS